MSQADKKDASASSTSNSATESAEESAEGKGRPGLPNKASVLSEKVFTSPTGKHYRIIRTDEMDPYDAPVDSKKQRSERDGS
jgi:hypothetical protein